MTDFGLRAATVRDADAVADVWLRSRRAAVKEIPAHIHPDDEVRSWISSHVLLDLECWVAERSDGEVVGLLALGNDWLEQLYVLPDRQGRGVGSALIDLAKRLRPEGLQLWTFASNNPARIFYERRGFVRVEETDGAHNEERARDMRYVYRPKIQGASQSST
ncbi:MAG: GNAT family N-acetyltransferase [Actinomycetota bacterium]|nr:GNAT family N-acetyltransferase [Actinomycetota bacterium]